MRKKECIAMILAGGQGSRLGLLTKKVAKPAVPFGGKYRIIDFTLSNCRNSQIDTVGVLTQYQPFALNSYIGLGSAWDLDHRDGGAFTLPPYTKESGAEWYKGTADAIWQNIHFIERYNPSYVLVLSGDHIYTMDYAKMIDYHKAKKADATISVLEVPWNEASRFGIMSTADTGRITDFQEKPANPNSNLASMGIYIFNWKHLKKHLEEDSNDFTSSHDFGKNVIPKMLGEGHRLFAYPFQGYWKDVGTVDSFWEANMDLLAEEPQLDIYNPDWRIYSVNPTRPPHYIAAGAKVSRSLISEGCLILGEVEDSVIFPGVCIGEGARIIKSIVMPYVNIGAGVQTYQAIIGKRVVVEEGARVGWAGSSMSPDITVVAENAVIGRGMEWGPEGVIPKKNVG
ncbi:Glucose-1-phosphate adenylyltransferase [bioreactor metagenome]|uniref:Glucose-1-phosphate adenylyltransferase n=1 Tax=bioreactor metagenome TaxID=1076179 RepID=A0A644TQN3_9ZZZZ|nr:glucose-1-phosphate adenylyltransferase [Negativicutes bacterium]